MDVIAITRQLGEALQQDERYIKYALARENNDSDAQLQNLIGEFNLLRLALNNELQKEPKDDAKVKAVNNDLRVCYEKVMANPSMAAFNEAKEALDALVNEVNMIISMCIEGADPATCDPSSAGCSGSCSTCGGCH